MDLRIGLNDFSRLWADAGGDVHDAVRAVGESGWYILGREVAAFEEQLAAYWGRRHAIGVASGLDALEIGLRAAGCKAGDRVLMSPVSAFATALAAVKLGAVPVFVDCDRYGLIDLDLAEEALERDSSIRFFAPVHLYGYALDIRRLALIGERLGVRIIEDCAQSIGAMWEGRPTGGAGMCAATSFYPTKNLGALGDGGALLTDSEEIAAAARTLRDYGRTTAYCHTQIGYNSRLDELQAAILRRVFLPRLNAWIHRRHHIVSRYMSEIAHSRVAAPGAPPGCSPNGHIFPILAPAGRKHDLLAHLQECGISAGEHYPIALADQPAMGEAEHVEIGLCANARDFCSREISLPVHPYLTDAEVASVIEAVNGWTG